MPCTFSSLTLESGRILRLHLCLQHPDPLEHVFEVFLHLQDVDGVGLEVPDGALQPSARQGVAVGEHLVRLLEPLEPAIIELVF